MRRILAGTIAAVFLLLPGLAQAKGLWDLYATLQTKKWVDLTHPFDDAIPHWKGFDPMTRKVLYDYDKDGFRAELFCHVGQWGTHLDPPVHFHKGARTADKIPIKQMLLPLVVIDVHRQAVKNADFVLTLKEVKAWEAKHGLIPKGAFVAMRTDWAKRWPSQDAMENVDAQGTAHYPGWTMAALKYLYEVRHITASGHETTDSDPGIATSKDDYALESYILGIDHYQIELLANLDKVPEAGALVSVTWPNIKDGTGFPARVFAILP
jgi:kynurenine formamidase